MKEEKKNKRQERRAQAHQREQKIRLRNMAIIAVIAVPLVFAFVWQQIKPITGIINPEIEPVPMANGASMGDPNAPIQIVEYLDFQCPHCERFFTDTEPLLVEHFVKTGKIQFTYRSAGNWVSSGAQAPNTESQDSAAAAYCAADQNKFWEMHAALFVNNRDVENQGSFSDRRLAAIAEAVGLDMTAFNECYNSSKYEDQVQQDLTDAEDAGITGTPFFVMTYKVNGQTQTETIGGAQTINDFQQKIEAALLIADK